MPKVTRAQIIGEQGVALIALRVGQMGHKWHPTVGIDSGIDGEIELRDSDGTVRNVRIGVQSRATEGIWRNESDTGFLYRGSAEQIAYWVDSDQPVILVCSRPKSDEAYFRNVQEWASDPARRASCIIDFDKQRDVFDASARDRLFALEGSRGQLDLDPPGPLHEPEKVLSNLLPVTWSQTSVWSVAAPHHEWGEIFERAREAGVARSDVALRQSRIWSLRGFSDVYLTAIGASDSPAATPIAELADGDPEQNHLLAELARRWLLEHHPELRWSPAGRAAHFRLQGEGKARKYRWTRSGSGRTVVLPRQSLNHEGLSGYRHDAAHLYFRRLGGAWFLSITPTYVFTFDGKQLSSFHAEALKKMKQQDRSAAVSQQLRMWATLFTRPATVLEQDEEPPFVLGRLIEITVPVSAPSGAWVKAPEDIVEDDEDDAGEGQMPLWESD